MTSEFSSIPRSGISSKSDDVTRAMRRHPEPIRDGDRAPVYYATTDGVPIEAVVRTVWQDVKD